MRKTTLTVMISTILLGATAANAEPADTTQSTTSQTTTTATTPASPAPVTSTTDSTTTSSTTQASAEYDAGNATAAAAKSKVNWTQADVDGNGTLSQAEVQAAMPTVGQSFAQIDANADGQLSKDEMQAYKMQHGRRDMQEKFTAADKDGDKLLDLAEASSMPMLTTHFTQVDVNRDGKVSMEELQSHHSSSMGNKWDKQPTADADAGTSASADADQRTSTSTTTSSTTSTTEADDKASDATK